MKSLGDSLREARKAHGVTLDAVARDTRISRRYLDALERGDLEALPGGVFATGYIKAYASFLGIDAAPLLEAYKVESEARSRPPKDLIRELHRAVDRFPASRKRRGRAFAVGVIAIGLLLVVAVSWVLFRNGGTTDAERASPRPPPPASAVATPLEPETEPVAVAEPERAPGVLAVPSHGVGTNVLDRELVGRADRFPEGTEVWFWTRVVGGETGDVVRHVWSREGRALMAAELRIGGPHWRTYSRLVLPPGSAGRWAVEARSIDGRRLAREEFACVAEKSAPRPSK